MRTWVYDTIRNYPGISALVGDRVFQGESLDGAPRTKPFIIYRFGNTSPDNDVHTARRQYFTVYCCDEAAPGDYMNIDLVLTEVVKAFTLAPPVPAKNIVCARWLESSSDQDDREMGVILRYARFQIIRSQWEPGARLGEV